MFHKIDVRNKEIYWNEQSQGRITTRPPKGTREQLTVASDSDITFLRLRWKVTNPPQPPAPLELFKIDLDNFIAETMFVAGRRYEITSPLKPDHHKKRSPKDAYYKFRIREKPPYDAALYVKLPMVCWESGGRAFAVAFPKFISLSIGKWPVFINPGSAGAPALFSVALPEQLEIDTRRSGRFGRRSSCTVRKAELSRGEPIEAEFALIAADSWAECVRKYAEWLYKSEQTEPLSTDSLADLAERSLHFYDRVWDGRNCTHVHLPVRNVPAFESAEAGYSHITDDITKLALYRRLIENGCTSLVSRERRLLERITRGGYSFTEDGNTLWHTTTYLNGHGLKSCSNGVGFVGPLGGMATNVRRLYEYDLHAPGDAVRKLADSGADWLLKFQREDGSWPALFEAESEERPNGCIASTAESARALAAAYRNTKQQKYLDAARAAAEFINRDAGFFECNRYLRHALPSEADGISSEACIHANLDLFKETSEERYLKQAEKWGAYALQWIRPCFFKEDRRPSFDPLSRSFNPRMDVWGGLLVARALLRLGRAGTDEWWLGLAWRLVRESVRLKEKDGGLCATWFFDYPEGFESVDVEPTFVTDALVDFVLDASENGKGKSLLPNEFLRRNKSLEENCPPLKPTAPIQNLVSLGKTEPEFIIDRNLRLSPGFSGVEDENKKFPRFLVHMLSGKSYRRLLRATPAPEMPLKPHTVKTPLGEIQRSDPVKIKSTKTENFDGVRRRSVYNCQYYTIMLSVFGAGMNPQRLPANDVGIDIEAVAGNLKVRQVRIDLKGTYSIKSVSEKKIIVSANGLDYCIWVTGGAVDGIIQQKGRLAFDISLSANWNFFGEYHLRMRIERG